MELPVKSRRRATPTIHATALVLWRQKGAQVLMLQRPHGSLWEGLWEFPVLPGKANARAQQPLKQSYGIKSLRRCGTVTHQLTHRRLQYDVLAADTRRHTLPSPLPVCGLTKMLYTSARWVPWPLKTHSPLPMAKVVHKIAAVASASPPPPGTPRH